jgi:hypothetical protein
VTAVSVTTSDLEPFASIDPAKAQAMIDDALALAARVAPCINDVDFAYPEAAKAIIRGAVLRWHEAGTGALQAQTAGPFGQSVDTRQQRRGMFWPSEITDLANLCASSTAAGRAYEVDTIPAGASDGYWAQPNLWVPLVP